MVGSFGRGVGGELGTLIKLKHSGLLEKLRFHLINPAFDSVFVRVNLYNVVNGVPDQNILKKPILVRSKIQSGDVVFDLSDYNIVLDKDFVISIENINPQTKHNGAYLSAGFFNSPSFIRKASQGKWYQIVFKKIQFGVGMNVQMRI